MAKYFIRPLIPFTQPIHTHNPRIFDSFQRSSNYDPLPQNIDSSYDQGGFMETDFREKLISLSEQGSHIEHPKNENDQTDYYFSSVQLGVLLNLIGFGRFQLKIILLIAIFTVALGIQSLSMSYLMPMVQNELEVTEFVVAWLPTTWYIGTLVGSFVFGVIGDRCGRRLGILLSALIASTFSLASAFTTNVWVLMALRAIVALGVGGSQPVCIAYLIQYAPDSKRGVIVLLIEACRISGGFLAVGLAWVFNDSYPLYLVSISLFMLLALLVLIPCLPESIRYYHFIKNYSKVALMINTVAKANHKKFQVEPALIHTSSHTKPPHQSFSQLVTKGRWKQTFAICLLWFVPSLGNGILMWLPTLLFNENYNTDQVYGFMGVLIVIPVVGMLVSSFCIDKVSRVLLLKTCLLFSAAPLILLGVLSNQITIYVVFSAMTVYVLSSRLLKSVTNAYTPESYPTRTRSTALGLMSVCDRLGSTIQPLVSVLFIPSGLKISCAIFGGTFVFCLLFSFCLNEVTQTGGTLSDSKLDLSASHLTFSRLQSIENSQILSAYVPTKQ